MSTLQVPETDRPPAPLEFFRQDAIHPDNAAVVEREHNRWRRLSWFERWKMQRYVNRMAAQLRKAGYNRLARELERQRRAIRKARYRHAKAADETEREQAKAAVLAIKAEARPVAEQLYALKELHHRYSHYRDWLDYEAQHRQELKDDAKCEAKDRAEMRAEARLLESSMINVFKKTTGCHYMKKDRESGKEKAVAPRFERSVIRDDAHYFYIAASRRFLFGVRWLLPYGVEIRRLIDEDVIQQLEAATKRQVQAVFSDTGQLMFRVSRLDSPDALPKLVKWSKAMELFPREKRLKLAYTIGVSEGRRFQWFDFATEPHMLIAGKSQSGKSNQVNGVIATLASTLSPEELRIVLIDMKGGIEFTHWHDLPHVLGDVVKQIEGVLPQLKRLKTIMASRLATMEKAKAKDIAAYNKRVDSQFQMARVLVIIDEMNTFVGMGKETDDIHNDLAVLASQGRAVGIHIICCTQHPEVAVIPSRIKTNMGMRISGYMPSVGASMVVLDGPEASQIPAIAGRLVASVGMKTLVVQSPFISDAEIAGVVSACQLAYPEVSENLSDQAAAPPLVVWNEQRMMTECLTLLGGQLGAQKLHKLIGDESPGERELSRLVKRIVDQVAAVGFVVHEVDGSRWALKKGKGGARILIPLPDNSVISDEKKTTLIQASSSEMTSEIRAFSQTESAAD